MKSKINRLVILAVLVLSCLLSACDNGGTIRPDAGCIGQGANFDSCMETMQAIGQ